MIRFANDFCGRPIAHFCLRCVGVIGGVFVCMGYAVRITSRAVEAVTGPDTSQGIVAAEATGISGVGRKRWGSTDLRLRPSQNSAKVIRQGAGWVVEGGSPYGSYANTPTSSGTFPSPLASPYLPNGNPSPPGPPPYATHRRAASSVGLGLGSPAFGPASSSPLASPAIRPQSMMMSPDAGASFPTAATAGSPYGSSPSLPPTPGSGPYTQFPPTPNTGSPGYSQSPPLNSPGMAGQQGPPRSTRQQSWLGHAATASVDKAKAD